MVKEIERVHLDLRKRSSFLDNKLILVWTPLHGVGKDKTYQVRHFKNQQDAILKLGEVFSGENDGFAERLEEMDQEKYQGSNHRGIRYAAENKSELPGRSTHKVGGVHLELNLDMIQKYSLAKEMCEAADIPPPSHERSIDGI